MLWRLLMKKIVIEKIVIALDMAGWEQDGKGPAFVCPATGERKKFKSWMEAYDFALKVHGKK